MSAAAWDAAVVGGGPAGCSAAIRLAREGLRVILFEAKTYPHDKMCGEFLSPECAGLLAPLGVAEDLRALCPADIHTARLTAPAGTIWEAPLPGLALGLSRKRLDQILAEKARAVGAEVEEGAVVEGILGSLEDGFTLRVRGRSAQREVTARVVIGAHGKRAALDRALGRAFLDQQAPYIAMKAHFSGPPVPGRIELHAFPGGYCGLSEIEEGRKVVCLLADVRVFQRESGRGGPEAFFAWMQGQNPYLQDWLAGAERIHARWITIAQVPFQPKPAMERDVLMAGDSAGLIVPLAGDGISMALEGGQVAARWAQAFLEGRVDAGGLRGGYPLTWKKRFSTRLRLGRALQPMLMRPRAASAALRILRLFPRVGRALVANTRGRAAIASDLYQK